MLTDDELTRELGTAFRAGTADLTYHGRRRPRRTAVVAVPVAAVTIAVATLAISLATNPGTTEPPVAGDPATPSAPASATPRLVTDSIDLAGYSFSYQRTAGETAPLYATEVDEVPDSAKAVDAPEGVKAWIGKDAKGDNALYVKAATRFGGNLFALHSSVWTQDELVDFFHNGTPKTVPLVKE